MATRNYQKMFEEAKKAKEDFFNEHREVLEEYKKLAGECGHARQEITEVRRAKRQEVMHYILDHDQEFTSSELYRLCNCENCYHSPSSFGSAIEYEWHFHSEGKIYKRIRTITKKYVEVDDNGHIIPGNTLSRKVEIWAYQARREK